MNCPVCGKTVEPVQMPDGRIIYIGTMMTTSGERVRRYDAGKERLALAVRTRAMAGFPVHSHDE